MQIIKKQIHKLPIFPHQIQKRIFYENLIVLQKYNLIAIYI